MGSSILESTTDLFLKTSLNTGGYRMEWEQEALTILDRIPLPPVMSAFAMLDA